MPIITDHFSALGTNVEGAVRTDPTTAAELFGTIRTMVSAFESRFSRFRPDSELSRMNRGAGSAFAVSDELFAIMRTAQRMSERTNRLVDVTVGNAMIEAGYDRSFELLGKVKTRRGNKVHSVSTTVAEVMIDASRRTVTLPLGATVDLGGIGKGYLLDQLLPVLADVSDDFWLSLGGDLIVSGVDDDGKPWSVGVQDPQAHDKDVARLHPPEGTWGIATSGTTKRHGVRDGSIWHHLIDPRTGKPAMTDVVAATVLAPSALEADAFAKVVLLLGSTEGLAWAASRKGIEALVITDGHHLIANPGSRSVLVPATTV